ncbi:uncharacterized protein LOC106062362 isoform X2 [Biomphalaria glabrata]|uniref:Uncharacterized protein LOC106062362 isoform X2 n=1 Tax=Biomphalaria glabrata TaxID=6526 RepID=A0A9W2Z5V2_BIOGL|nr:uncharacterized protein LOC106062362 isoform X2 [Biomphalaria glabrata]
MDDGKPMKRTTAGGKEAAITCNNFQVQFNKLLKDAISDLFISFVRAENIVSVFKKYSQKVLVDKDIEIVKRKAEYKGNIEANEELLNRLVTYNDWFPCLLQCLRDKDVNQGHVAQQMEDIGDFLRKELERELENQKFQYSTVSSSAGKLLQLCTMCIEQDFSPNSRRILMKIKQITFDILTHLIFSTTLISQELTDKDILNAIENVLASPEFHQDQETNKEIKMARADIKRDIVLILSSVVRNIDLRENSLLNIKFEQILKKTLVDQDTLVHDLSLLLSAYVQNDFFKFLKEMTLNLDDMLQSLLSHLRFYATYSVVNSKVEIQILAYLEGLEKLATFEKIKKKMKDMSVLKKLYCIIKEIGSSKCYVAFVSIQSTLDFFQAEEKNQETTETEGIKRLQESCLEDNAFEKTLSRNAVVIENCLKEYCEKLSRWRQLQEYQVRNDLTQLLKIIHRIQNRIDEFHAIFISSKLPETLELICLYLKSKEILHTALMICLTLVEKSSFFSQALVRNTFFNMLSSIMEGIEGNGFTEPSIFFCLKELSENTQNMASLIMLTTVNQSKEKCFFLDNTDIRKKLSNCVRSSNYLVFVTAKVLLSPHEKQDDAIKFLIHWLKEAMSNQQYMTKHGLSAKLILYCLYLLSSNSSNKRMIEENAYVTTLHQHIHLETDPSIALNYILLLKKLEEEEEKEELPAIMSFEKHEPFRENVTLKDISTSNTLEVRKEVEETLPTNVSFGKYELSKENVKLSIPISTNNALQVWKGRMNAGVDVAVKMNSGSMPQNEFLIEAKILSKMQNEHIIQFLGVVLDQTSYIVTEFIPNGTLLKVLKTDYANLIQLYDILVMNVEVCEGMNYLESHKIVHRDLRAENIFVGYNFKVYIAGFGNATAIDNENHQISRKDYSYKIKWAAPEAAKNKQFSSKSDVWSFGILMYETVTFGCEPYDKKSDSDVIQMIQDGGCLSKPQNERFEIPVAFYDIMKSCWRLLPEDRPTFENLLNNFVKYV